MALEARTGEVPRVTSAFPSGTLLAALDLRTKKRNDGIQHGWPTSVMLSFASAVKASSLINAILVFSSR
jgi:hypothetical protein